MIGRGVLRLRLYHGWSQRLLERKAKVDQTTISRLENGKQHGLSIRKLAAILDALQAGDVIFDQPKLLAPPSSFERLIYGDRWARACREADRRLRWPGTGERPGAGDGPGTSDLPSARRPTSGAREKDGRDIGRDNGT